MSAVKVPGYNLPLSFELEATQRQYEAYIGLATTTVAQYADQMPNRQTVNFAGDSGKDYIRMVSLDHPDQATDKEAVALILPFGNGYSPAMHIRARALQELAGEPKRVLIFPNNTLTEKYYQVSDSTDAGTQLATKVSRSIAKLGIERADIVGFSQGAMVGGRVISKSKDEFELGGVMLGEPPNVVDRSPKQLAKDFKGKGLGLKALRALNRAIDDSGIPALSEVQATALTSRVRQLRGFGEFAKGAKLPENHLLQEDMAHNTFVDDVASGSIRIALSHSQLSITRMGQSLVCTEDLDRDVAYNPSLRRSLEVIDGYGHEGGDNVVLYGLQYAALQRRVYQSAT